MPTVPPLPPDWLSLFDQANLVREFGEETVARAARYVTDGRIARVQVTAEAVTAEVRGTRPWPYHVLLEPFAPLGGFCTCPVETDCKHVAALALHLAQEARADNDWEARLGSLLPSVRHDPATLGLRFELVDSDHLDRQVITFRPVRPGKRGGWVRTGASWNDLQYGHRTPYLDHPARPALVELRHHATRREPYTWRSDVEAELGEIGPVAWTLLDRVTAAGVQLVHGTDGRVLVGPPLAPHIDATRADDGAVVLQPRFSVAATDVTGSATPVPDVLPPGDPMPVGEPVFAVASVVGSDLRLWPLDPFPDKAFVDLLSGPPVRIPAADVPRFRSWFLPRLRRITPVDSADGSVELPPDPAPELVARVRHLPGHHTELDLSYRYRPGDGGTVVDVPITGDPDPADAPLPGELLRDHAAEGRLLDQHLGEGRFLREPRAQHRLSGRDTIHFVSDILPRLAAEGVIVENEGDPVSYAQPAADPVIEFDLSDSDGTAEGAAEVDRSTDWFDLAISISVDGQGIPMIPLIQALASGEQLLVLDSGLVLDLRRNEFDRLRDLLAAARALGDPEAGALQMHGAQIGVWEELQAYGVVRTETARWRTLVDAALTTVSEDGAEVEPPVGLLAELRPYQRAGFGWLDRLWRCGLGGILADDMGLGKTVQALAAILAARQRAASTPTSGAEAPVLVVAPTSVVPNWVSEAERFTPGLRVTAVTATRRRRGSSLADAVADADVVVTTYALLRLESDAYAALDWSALLLDEAQQVKNHRAKGYRAVRRLRVGVRFVITGTPLENSLMELWTMLSIAAPGLFPDPEAFGADVAKPIEKGNREVLALLRRRIRPLMLRRTKELVAADLPPKQEQTLLLPLDDKHRKLYDTRLARERQRVLGLLTDLDSNRIEVLQALTTLRQLALSAALVDPADAAIPSAKIEALAEHVEELAAEGHRALVFSQFTRFLDLIGTRLDQAGLAWERLDGSMTVSQRERAVTRFRDGPASVFLISLKAGGFGLNLTEADYVFVMDPWWNPAAEAQAIDRTHRIGQTRPVNVYRMLAADTIEAKVAALQERKRDLFSRVIDAEAGMADSRLSADDLRELFS